MEKTTGTVIDSIADASTVMFRGKKDSTFTIREWANADGKFDWSAPDADGLDCITEVADSSFLDTWSRFRQVAFQLSTADCRVEITLSNLDTSVADKKFEVVVWPLRSPESEGTMIDLGKHTFTDVVKLLPEADVTFIQIEPRNDLGFKWENVEKTDTFTCIDLIDNNLGDFNTGYAQWHFKAKSLTYNCTETIVLEHANTDATEKLLISV